MPCNNRSHQIEIYVSASHPTSKPKMYLLNLASSPTSQQRVDGVRVALLERLHPPPYPPQRALHGEVDDVRERPPRQAVQHPRRHLHTVGETHIGTSTLVPVK